MKIIAESGILIFRGCHALKGRALREQGQNEHFTENRGNKDMLVNFIHSSLKIAAFIGMVKMTPEEAAAADVKHGGDCTDEAESEVASAVDEDEDQLDMDPLKLAELSLSPKPNPLMAAPVPPFPVTGSSIASGDGSWVKIESGENTASSNQGSATLKASPPAAPAAAAEPEVKFKAPPPHLRKTTPGTSPLIAPSDESKDEGSSKEVIKAGNVVLTSGPAVSDDGQEKEEKAPKVVDQQSLDKKNEDRRFTYDILVTLKKELAAYGPG